MDYRVGGITAANVATASHGVATLWNPSTSVEMWLKELHFVNTTAASALVRLARITGRGTPGSTVTPDIDNEYARAGTPPSGALLDLAAYTVQPTVDASALDQWTTPATIGAGKVWSFGSKGLLVPPGAGVGLVNQGTTSTPVMNVTCAWSER